MTANLPKGMSDKETAAHLRRWCLTTHHAFVWPTDGCGYEQHIRFVEHRNTSWQTGDNFTGFVLAYADSLDRAQ